MTRTIGDGDPKDFDETRRLLYMALMRSRTEKYQLAGTLVNALAHHHALADDNMPVDDIMDHVVNVIEGTDEGTRGRAWLKTQIRRISHELGD